jgi:hypothetical protein
MTGLVILKMRPSGKTVITGIIENIYPDSPFDKSKRPNAMVPPIPG